MYKTVDDASVPVIARINGHALSGVYDLASSMAEKSPIALEFTKKAVKAILHGT